MSFGREELRLDIEYTSYGRQARVLYMPQHVRLVLTSQISFARRTDCLCSRCGAMSVSIPSIMIMLEADKEPSFSPESAISTLISA